MVVNEAIEVREELWSVFALPGRASGKKASCTAASEIVGPKGGKGGAETDSRSGSRAGPGEVLTKPWSTPPRVLRLRLVVL